MWVGVFIAKRPKSLMFSVKQHWMLGTYMDGKPQGRDKTLIILRHSLKSNAFVNVNVLIVMLVVS